MIRRVNFTGRNRILRQHVSCSVVSRDGGAAELHVQLDLASYDFPPNAEVFVEAYRGPAEARWRYGTVARPVVPADRTLGAFGVDTYGIRCRVRVVEAGGGIGRLLGVARSIPLENEVNERTEQVPLIPVACEDLGQETWKVDFDGGYGPRMLLNSRIDNYKTVARSPVFTGLVYPQVMREILIRALVVLECDSDADNDSDDWPSKWLRFARAANGDSVPDDEDGRLLWVDEAVRSFASKHRMLTTFQKGYEGRE